MLFSRLGLFLCIQGIFAFVSFIFGKEQPLETSANWWPLVIFIANLICVFLLARLFKSENKSFWDILKIEKSKLRGDLLAILVVLIIAAPISLLPNTLLAKALFGDSQASLDLLIRPLPYWAAFISIIVFPVTQGLAEIPTYFSYVMPQFKKMGFTDIASVGLPAVLLGLQHVAVPFLFNTDFIIWRALMFLPFALLVGIVMKWRARLLPYLAIVHVLMDMSFAVMLLSVAY